MHAKSKFSGMLPKSFNAGKCKTALKLAVSRIRLLKNKREAAVKQSRRDLAQLLAEGQEQTARIRVEHVIREKNAMSAYDLIEVYCEMIVVRLPIIESQKVCPIDLKEAITSVVFAAPKCADIPELMDVRKHFTAKYGKEFIAAATEVRPDCGVSRMMIEKLSTQPPDVEMKIKVLKAAAKEHNVTWEPNPFGESIQMPKEDLLNGPTSFISGSMLMKSSPTHSWDNVPTKRVSQTDSETTQPVISNTIQVDAEGLSNLASSRISAESKSSGEEVNHTYSKDEGTSISRPNWTIEFKDATAAAEAAAESAERASLAARAAAELASRGSFTRHQSIHDKNGISGSLRNSPSTVKESMDREGDKRRSPDGIKMDVPYHQKGNMTQASRSPEAKSLNYRQPKTVQVTQGRSHSSGMFQEPGGKLYDNSQTSLSDRSAAANNFNNRFNGDHVKILNEKHNKWVPSPGSTSSGADKIWPDRESIMDDFPEVASGDCDSDTDAHSAIGEEEDLLDFLRHGKRQSSRTKIHMRESPSSDGSLQMDSMTGRDRSSSSGRVVKASASKLNNSVNYEGENAIDATKPSSLRRQGNYRKETSANEKRVVQEDIPGSWSDSSPDASPGFSPPTNQRTSRNISSLSVPESLSEGRSEEEEETSDSPFSEESSVSGGLNFGRLTGGLRNRSYHRPPHVRKPSTDESPRSRITSLVSDDVTSLEARIELKSSQESRAKLHSFKLDACEEQSHNAEGGQGGEKINVPPKSEVSNQVMQHDQKPSTKVNNNDPRPRMMMSRYSNLDSDEYEEQEPRRASIAAINNDVKHSRRTAGVPPDAKGDDASLRRGGSFQLNSPLRSETDTLNMNTRRAKVSGGVVESEYGHSSADGSTKKLVSATSAGRSQNSDTKNDVRSKASVVSSTSRESSLKKGSHSHTHPKLPDYDSLAEYFQSLRSNVRPR